jgi:hypothetical protein
MTDASKKCESFKVAHSCPARAERTVVGGKVRELQRTVYVERILRRYTNRCETRLLSKIRIQFDQRNISALVSQRQSSLIDKPATPCPFSTENVCYV